MRPKFNSQELDEETNFYFYNARYYDPQIARFVTADNVIDGENTTQGWNRFSYVKNNPIIYKDPTGHLSANPAIDKKIKESEESGARYKVDALKNFDAKTSSTEIDGIKLQFSQGKLAGYNTPDKIKKIDQKMWKNLVVAAKCSGIKEIGVSAVDYSKPNEPSNSHTKGLAIDLAYIKDSKGTAHFFNREYDKNTDKWNNLYNTNPEKIKQFTRAFMSSEGSTTALTPYTMHYNKDKIGYNNRIDQYPDVGTTGDPGMNQSNEYIAWAKKKEFSQEEQDSFYWDFQHSTHGHLEVKRSN